MDRTLGTNVVILFSDAMFDRCCCCFLRYRRLGKMYMFFSFFYVEIVVAPWDTLNVNVNLIPDLLVHSSTIHWVVPLLLDQIERFVLHWNLDQMNVHDVLHGFERDLIHWSWVARNHRDYLNWLFFGFAAAAAAVVGVEIVVNIVC